MFPIGVYGRIIIIMACNLGQWLSNFFAYLPHKRSFKNYVLSSHIFQLLRKIFLTFK